MCFSAHSSLLSLYCPSHSLPEFCPSAFCSFLFDFFIATPLGPMSSHAVQRWSRGTNLNNRIKVNKIRLTSTTSAPHIFEAAHFKRFSISEVCFIASEESELKSSIKDFTSQLHSTSLLIHSKSPPSIFPTPPPPPRNPPHPPPRRSAAAPMTTPSTPSQIASPKNPLVPWKLPPTGW